MIRKSFAALLVACTMAAGCIDLEVAAVQPQAGTAFTREEVLADPSLIELVVAGVFVNFWGGATYNQPFIVLSIYGEEITSSATSVPNVNRIGTNPSKIWEHVQEPRLAFDNGLTTQTFFSRDPWSNFYEANAAATDMPRIVRERGIRIIDNATGADNTDRFFAFSRWIQGMSHVYLGLLFDSAAIIDNNVDLTKVPAGLPFRGYKEVLDSGVKWLEDVIKMCDSTTFVLPLANDVWVYNSAFTNSQMKAVAHTYIARALAYAPRTPEEVADVNWQAVKDHLLQGITAPFGPSGFPNPLNTLDYRAAVTAVPQRINSICQGPPNNTNYCHPDLSGAFRVDYRLIGPADTSGAYQTWLTQASGPNAKNTQPFIIRTKDARIQAEGNTTPNPKPTFFKYTDLRPPIANFGDSAVRGTVYISNYWSSSRARNNHTQFPAAGGGANRRNNADLGTAIQDAMVLVPEVRLLLAEAEFRLGHLQAAADIINETRVGNGELPPVTAAGVPASTPGQPCIPRRYDSSCGSLFDALMYEKRIETYGSGIAFFDARRWGCLLEGTLTQLPPPGRQLDLLGKLIYSYGGHPGSVGSASKPNNCPLMYAPS